MNFARIGNVDLTDFEFHLRYKSADGSSLSFNLLNTSMLKRAHFYDEVKKAHLDIYVTYAVEITCFMRSGHKVKLSGECTPLEYQLLLDRTGIKQRGINFLECIDK